MKFSQNFVKTTRQVATDQESINAKLLTQAGFIHQEIAGVYTFLPLGLRVLFKIENIIRKEMDKIGVEVLMPSLAPKDPWQKTDRLEKIDVLFKASGANKGSIERNSTEYILNSTHEEIITPIVQKYVKSYKDLPVGVYQIQTKFRNEPRAKSGLLRTREFRMKDLYSFHRTEKDLLEYYEQSKKHYLNVFEALGLGDDTYVTYASGGDFTEEYSHEFQTLLENGEDTIYLDRKNRIAYNKEVTTPQDAKKLGVDFSKMEQVKASEVGNIFPLNTKFSKAFNFTYTDENNKQQIIYMGSYGIGPSRLIGVIAEKFADDKGLVWPEQVAPFKYHLISLFGEGVQETSQKVYAQLGADNVLWDDRESAKAGEKFTDAELIGCPVQIIVSAKSLEQKSVEVKSRNNAFETYLLKITDLKKLVV